ncbi:bifunctional molybdenum cofactor biosynthesis protein MoaC/MoaB [Marinigracilibium pacificum]|uniref:Bifunctional molybdenum cofactor biosynthesis protein MoaC/MoaB n=1 Tax=Marinigracilibium pacificum TaxID=2729599 RepID=A0A848IYQ5_9BACT|nr:bifunctional molybdenum cofactor biosynthesis protein MoaC/MoaB [Marinigracilibium pacificum]NMM48298.1 bifunctional molybdenum cofactor biosynthesis protein MoaC/MoaB [Marinigracilibium pacificum]
MIDITHKVNTLREATALAIVKASSPDTINRIKENTVPKGNVFEMSKAAGLLGIKKTPDLLPDCHPLPIEYTGIEYQIQGLEIHISVTIKTIYKTGVEVEAMHGASIVALNMYDMLKPIDKNIEIGTIRLEKKKGGKSSFRLDSEGLTAQIVVCSDTISKGEGEDKAGKIISSKLSDLGIDCDITIIPDDKEKIKAILSKNSHDMIIYTGGTGVGPRDVTPDVIEPLLDIRLKGVEEQMRNYGQQRMPYAMLSRSVAGIKDGRLVLILPGSTKGAAECIDSIFPHVLHVYKVIEGSRHD